MPFVRHVNEKCTQAPRRLWKVGVLKQRVGSARISREEKLRKMAEHVKRRVEHVRSLVHLRTQIEKERAHVRVTRRSLRARLRRSEMTCTDFENEMKDASETLQDYKAKWAALREAGKH